MTASTGHGTLRRVAACLAVISACVHAAMLRQHVDRFAVVLLVLALACLGCAVMLWRSSGPGEWTAMAMLNVIMLTTHGLWPAVQPAMDHTNRLQNHHQSGSLTLMHAALALAVVETLLAVAGLFGALLGEQREITGKNAASPGASGTALPPSRPQGGGRRRYGDREVLSLGEPARLEDLLSAERIVAVVLGDQGQEGVRASWPGGRSRRGSAIGLAALVSIGTSHATALEHAGADPMSAVAHGYAFSFAVAAGLTAFGALLAFLGSLLCGDLTVKPLPAINAAVGIERAWTNCWLCRLVRRSPIQGMSARTVPGSRRPSGSWRRR